MKRRGRRRAATSLRQTAFTSRARQLLSRESSHHDRDSSLLGNASPPWPRRQVTTYDLTGTLAQQLRRFRFRPAPRDHNRRRVAPADRPRGWCDVNPYAVIGSSVGTTEAASLSERLAAWHDAMVAHER